MNAKEVWCWIFNNLDVERLYSIIKETKVVFRGFRLNSSADLQGNNRKLFLSTLLQKQNLSKIKLWIIKEKPFSFDNDDICKNKEMNELYTMCITQSNPLEILLNLIQENDEKKAIQFYAYLKEENLELLQEKIMQNKSSVQEVKGDASKGKETTEKKKEDVKLSKLEEKILNLKEEIEKRDKSHKETIQLKDEHYSKLLTRYNEKNQLYTEMLKASKLLEEKFKKEKERWEQHEDNLQKQIKQKDKEISKLVEELQINKLEVQGEVKQLKKKILLIGNPMNNRLCNDENFDFDILEDEIDMEYYHFKEKYDGYWVLSYILNNKSRKLLQKNISFNKLDSKKVVYFYDFLTLKNKVEALKRDKVRV